MPSLVYLLDTNILLRVSKREWPEFKQIHLALRSLYEMDAELCYTSQNLREFWNVITRPAAHNGFGLSITEADRECRRIERAFRLLSENNAIHQQWRKLVLTYGISGVQVHDAHLVAAMKIHGISHLLTLNDRDFVRYQEITAVHPSQLAVET
jgi:predicted nucleic acid-binding protein